MPEYLEFVTIDIWEMIFTWLNLLILFLVLKKILFKPVNKILDDRAAEIADTYKNAENIQNNAENMLSEYKYKLQTAEEEADKIIKSASDTARDRSDKILNEARTEARCIAERTQKQIERDKQKAIDEARGDIAEIAVSVAEKLIGKRYDESTDEQLIESIIDSI